MAMPLTLQPADISVPIASLPALLGKSQAVGQTKLPVTVGAGAPVIVSGQFTSLHLFPQVILLLMRFSVPLAAHVNLTCELSVSIVPAVTMSPSTKYATPVLPRLPWAWANTLLTQPSSAGDVLNRAMSPEITVEGVQVQAAPVTAGEPEGQVSSFGRGAGASEELELPESPSDELELPDWLDSPPELLELPEPPLDELKPALELLESPPDELEPAPELLEPSYI